MKTKTYKVEQIFFAGHSRIIKAESKEKAKEKFEEMIKNKEITMSDVEGYDSYNLEVEELKEKINEDNTSDKQDWMEGTDMGDQ